MSDTPETALGFAKSFWELRVYQRARLLQGRIFTASKNFPPEERHSLTDQIRRASRSIGAQIAEAWGKRDYVKHFQSKLTDAESENLETQHWLITSVDDGYLTPEFSKPLFLASLEIGRMLATMSERASEFCPDWKSPKVQDPSQDFFLSPHELYNFPALSTEH